MYEVYGMKQDLTHVRCASFDICLGLAMERNRILENEGVEENFVIEYNGRRVLSISGDECVWYPAKTLMSGDSESWFNNYYFECEEAAKAFASYLGESRCRPGGYFKHKASVSKVGNDWLVTQLGGQDI